MGKEDVNRGCACECVQGCGMELENDDLRRFVEFEKFRVWGQGDMEEQLRWGDMGANNFCRLQTKAAML